jgi:hypothetical protein
MQIDCFTIFHLSRFRNRQTESNSTGMDATDMKKTQQARMLQKLELEQ